MRNSTSYGNWLAYDAHAHDRYKRGEMFLTEITLDDLMRESIGAIHSSGEHIAPSKGDATEIVGVLLKLRNPRARFSVSETRARLFSALGEFFWYLSGSNALDQIQYYLERYDEFADGPIVYGGYGPRLFGTTTPPGFTHNQILQITSILKTKPASRQAVIQLFDAEDLREEHKDVPCTCTLQFMIRGGYLQMITSMRSNDVYLGLPHDVFAFTMLQEVVARSLGLDVGEYRHFVGSLHLYDKDRASASAYLAEGWQPSGTAMPRMPEGDPWPSIESVLAAEKSLRLTGELDRDLFSRLDPYWADIVRLLEIFALKKRGQRELAQTVAESITTDAYDVFIAARLKS